MSHTLLCEALHAPPRCAVTALLPFLTHLALQSWSPRPTSGCCHWTGHEGSEGSFCTLEAGQPVLPALLWSLLLLYTLPPSLFPHKAVFHKVEPGVTVPEALRETLVLSDALPKIPAEDTSCFALLCSCTGDCQSRSPL